MLPSPAPAMRINCRVRESLVRTAHNKLKQHWLPGKTSDNLPNENT